MKKLDKEEIYRLIDLLEISIKETPNKIIMSKSQRKESIEYDKTIIKKLMKLINE